MNLQRTTPWKLPAGVVVGVVIAIVLIAWKWDPGTKPLEVHYPYWCKDCGAVLDVSELKKDYPRNWRIAPGGPSDSVVLHPEVAQAARELGVSLTPPEIDR